MKNKFHHNIHCK